MTIFFQNLLLPAFIFLGISNTGKEISNNSIIHHVQHKVYDNNQYCLPSNLITLDTIPKPLTKDIYTDSLEKIKQDSLIKLLQNIIQSKPMNTKAFRPRIF